MENGCYFHRQNAAREKFKNFDILGIIVSLPEKIRYLTGAKGIDNSFCLVTSEECYLLTDGRFREAAHEEAQNTTVIVYNEIRKYQIKQGIYVCLRDLAKECGILESLGADLSLSYENVFKIEEHFGEEIIYCDNLIEQLVLVKEPKEMKCIERAIELTEMIFRDHILPRIQPNITENELAAWISFYGKKLGAEKDAFGICVVSGIRSSLPHGAATNKKIQKGEIVQFDFGYVVDGYFSDFSRVVFVGEPTEEQKKIYSIVRESQRLALEAARPGITCAELDLVARRYVQKQGYDIPHGLGHGLGILVHSAPHVRSTSVDVLQPGFVVTIEPGVYIPGWGGIRLEDVICITEKGCRNLTTFTKEIIVV